MGLLDRCRRRHLAPIVIVHEQGEGVGGDLGRVGARAVVPIAAVAVARGLLEHAIAAARLGFRVTGIDYEPLALKRARRFARMKQVTGIIFRKANIFHLPFREAAFDVVLDYGCLHHQRKPDWSAYKTGILQVLKPEGFYVLSVFSPEFPLFRGSRRPWHIAQGAYRRYFTRVDIEQLFRSDFEFLELTKERGAPRGFWHVLMKRREDAR